MTVRPIPEGFRTVTPYLVVKGVPRLIEFLVRAFEAEEAERTTLPDGTIMNVSLRIGDSMIMMGEARGEFAPMPASILLYVKDADALYRRALDAGAASMMEPADQFYGDRNAGVRDPAGNLWWIATHIEDVPPDEMKRRVDEFARKGRRG